MVDLVAMGFTVDIEITNRCNAKCYFCPRDQTPHQGMMSPDVFRQALQRVVEFRSIARQSDMSHVKISLCGLGEPLLNRHTPSFVRLVREAGFECVISSNGSLLDEQRGRELLDAGLQGIMLNVGDRGQEYDDVYKLPFEKTRENVVRFAEMAGDECRVIIVLVDHRQDPAYTAQMREYWTGLGIDHFVEFGIMNRGGTLFVDRMQYDTYPEHGEAMDALGSMPSMPRCVAPFVFQFIGYDGNYYLCCSDWKKEVALGSVFDRSLQEVMADKWRHVSTRLPICAGCNLDPVNRLTDELRGAALAPGSSFDKDAFVEEWGDVDRAVVDVVSQLDRAAQSQPASKRRIPLTVVG